MLFVWDSSFLTHLPSVDEQHEQLVVMLNELCSRSLTSGATTISEFEGLRDRLLQYAEVHFRDEETQMEGVGVDPRHLEAHRAAHRSFVTEVVSFSEISEAELQTRIPEVAEFIMAWLTYHILGLDQSMARQIRAIQAGNSPSQAFEHESGEVNESKQPLFNALTRLFQMVSTRNHELRTLNIELERRVQERTAELESVNVSLERTNSRDDLTGVYNRRFALRKLKALSIEARQEGMALSILMVDADRFKEVNDQFGHGVGDGVLRALAARLVDSVRVTDFVCRIGGDEFLVICPGSTKEGTERIAAKILDSRESFQGPDGVVCWDGNLSIGVAELNDDSAGPEQLLKAADESMYAMKRLGGGASWGSSVSESGGPPHGTGSRRASR